MANQSSVNPSVPALDSDLVSSVVRQNFAAAASDLNALFSTLSSIKTPIVAPLGVLGSSATVDASVSRVFTATLGASTCAFLPTTSGLPDSLFLAVLVRFTQDSVGNRALAAVAGVTWTGSGFIPGLNSAPGSTADVEYISFDSGATWVASVINQTQGS